MVRHVSKYFQVPQRPPYAMSPAGAILLLVFLGWLFGCLLTDFFKLMSSIKFSGIFSVDSSKLWIRTVSEDFSTVLNRMLIFKQSSIMCSIFFLHFGMGFFSHSLLIFIFFFLNVHLLFPGTLECLCDLFSLFTIFYTILK